MLLHFHIDLFLIHVKADCPTEEHPGYGKEQGTEIESCVLVNVMIQPGNQVYAGFWMYMVHDGYAHFGDQINE